MNNIVTICFLVVFLCVCACRVCFICRYYCVISLLAEVSHDEAKWNERRETSDSFQQVPYHACALVSLTASDVFVTCKTTQRTGLNLSVSERLLNLSVRSNFKWTNQSWGWNDLASGRCHRPHHVHHKSLTSDGWSGFPANRGLSRRSKNERFAIACRETRKRIASFEETKYDFSL